MSTTKSRTESVDRSTAPRGGWNIALWILQGLTAAFFAIASALPKLIAHSSAVEFFDEIGWNSAGMYIIGVLELAGAIALVIPILSGLAAVAFMGLMVGALITSFVALDGKNFFTPILLFVIAAIIAWGRRDRLVELLAFVSIRRRNA